MPSEEDGNEALYDSLSLFVKVKKRPKILFSRATVQNYKN